MASQSLFPQGGKAKPHHSEPSGRIARSFFASLPKETAGEGGGPPSEGAERVSSTQARGLESPTAHSPWRVLPINSCPSTPCRSTFQRSQRLYDSCWRAARRYTRQCSRLPPAEQGARELHGVTALQETLNKILLVISLPFPPPKKSIVLG